MSPGDREEPSLGTFRVSPGSRDREALVARSRSRSRRIYALAVIAAFFVMILAIPLTYVVFLAVRAGMSVPDAPVAAATPPDPVPEAAPVAADPVPEPVPDADADAEPIPHPDSEPDPDPDPGSAPRPKPSGAAGLVAEGWNLASKDPQAASERFRAALTAEPGNLDATYGLGYCLNRLGQTDAAKPHLCKAVASGPPDMVREASAIIGRNGLTCP